MKLYPKLTALILFVFICTFLHAQTYQWAKNIGGTGDDQGNSIYTDNNGFVYIVGSFQGTNIDFDPSPTAVTNLTSSGSKDAFVAKYTITGTFVWAFKIGGTGIDVAQAVTVDATGNVIVTGFFRGNNIDFDPGPGTALLTSNGDNGSDPGYGGDVFIAKYSSSGQYLWAFNIGGTQIGDAGITIANDAAGNVYAGGYFASTADFDPSPTSTKILDGANGTAYLAKYNASGQYQWAFNYGLGNSNNSPFGIKVDAAGNVYSTGYFSGTNIDFNPSPTVTNALSSNGNFEIFVSKYNTNGEYQWAFSIGGPNSDVGRDVEIDPAGNVYVVGDFNGTNIDFDPSPTGTAYLSSSGYDVFLAKYNNNGQFQWAKKYGGTGNDISWSLTYVNNAIYITGSFQNTINFSPTGVDNLTSNGANDFYLTKFDLSGNYICSFAVGGSGNDDGYKIDSDNSGNLFITGLLSSTNTDFNPSPTLTNNLSTNGGGDIFFASYTWPDNGLPTGTLTGGAICGGSQGQLTYTATTGTGPFTIQYSDGTTTYTQANVQSGVAFNLSPNPTVTTTYTLVSVRGSERCAAVNYPTGITAMITNCTSVVQASFTSPDTICVNKPVTIVNTSSGTTTQYWSFCASDLSTVSPAATSFGNLGSMLDIPAAIDYALYNGNYYGFITNNGTTPGLIRLDYGNSLLNTPTAVNLGNFGGNFPRSMQGLQLVNTNGRWYLIMVGGDMNISVQSRVLVFDFGVTLTNPSPTLNSWIGIGGMDYPTGLHVFQWGSNWYGIVTNAWSSMLTRLSFGTNFSSVTATNLGNIGAANIPTGLFPIKDGNNYCIFVCNLGNSTLTRLDFGSSPLNTPTGVNLGNMGGILNGPRDLHIFKDCNKITGFLLNASTNSLVRLNFPTLTSTPLAASLGDPGGFSNPLSFSRIFRDGPDIYSFWVNANNSFGRLKFAGCNIPTPASSTLVNPPTITYPTPGTYTIKLSVDEGMETESSFCKPIVVLPAPVHSATQNISICAGDSVTLNSNFSNATYIWNTGATTSSIKAKTSGTYWVESTTTGGCSVRDSVVITSKPAPSVYAGADVSICGNDSAFLNATGTGSFSWAPTAGLSNPLISNPKASPTITTDYIVTLTSANGCSAKDTIRVNALGAGSKADFTYSRNSCNPKNIQYFSVSNAANYSWDFGNGTTNTISSNPIVTYANYGTYTVKLKVQASNGCTDSITKNISIELLQDDNLIATNDLSICIGNSVSLNISDTGLNHCWSPVTGISNPNSATPTITPTATTTYYFTSQTLGNNLIVNGDFSAGNTGFVSSYTYSTSGLPAGVYYVGTSPYPWHPTMPPCTDHTSGNGNMLLVNGAEQTNVPVWSQTITVTPNTNYAFSSWVETITTVNPALLQFSINGIRIGNIFQANNSFCIWDQFYAQWNSGNNTSAVISIVNMNSDFSGNDFALDDISFSPVIMKQDSIKVTVTPKPIITSSALANGICQSDSSQLNASGATYFSWTPATGLSDPTIANPKASPSITTTYTVSGYDITGCNGTNTVTVTIKPKPVITKSGDANICKDSILQLSATAPNALSYSWTPLTGLSNAAIDNPTASPAATTNYIVLVTGTNGCTNTDSVKVMVRNRPSVSVRQDTSVCNGSPVTLTTNNIGASIFNWLPANGLSDASNANPVATPTATTRYLFTATNSVGCNDTASMLLTIKPKPLIIKSADANICKDSTVQISALASNILTYTWVPVTGLSNASVYNPLANPITTTNYIVTADGANGCSSKDSVLVTVFTKPTVHTRLDTSVCNKTPITLTTNSSNANTITWSPATGLSNASIPNPIATPGISTQYIVTAVNGVCSAKDTINLGILPLPNIVKSIDTTICRTGTANLLASGGTSYSWLPINNLSNPSSPTPTATPGNTTKYFVTVTGANTCTAMDSILVTVNPKPVFGLQPAVAAICKGDSILLTASGGDTYGWVPPLNMSAPNAGTTKVYPSVTTLYKVGITSVSCKITDTLSSLISLNNSLATFVAKTNDIDCSHGQATLHATGGAKYEWTAVPGITDLGSANPVVTPLQTTTYYVKITDSKGCTGYDSVKVNVDFTTGISQYQIPSAFTPNGDGKNDCFGLKYWGAVTQLDFAVYSRWGQVIFHTKNPNDCWDGKLNGQTQDSGTYIYQIKAKTACGDVYRKGTVVLIR